MRSIISIASVLAATALPSSAVAAWTPPVEITPGGSDPQIAMDADGDAVITWIDFAGSDTAIWARTRSRAGILGPIRRVSASADNTSPPVIDIDSDGDALLAWTREDRVQARTISVDGGISTIRTISAPSSERALSPDVAVDGDGDATIAWTMQELTVREWVQARTRSADGALGPIEDLTARASGNFARLPALGVDDENNAVITWQQRQNGSAVVGSRALDASGALSPAAILSSPRRDTFGHQVDVDVDGDAVATWNQEAPPRVLARARSAAGTLGPLEELSTPGSEASGAQVAVDPGGDAVLAYTQRDQGGVHRVRVRGLSAAGALGPPQTLSSPEARATTPAVGVGDGGRAVLAWRREVAAGSQIRARTRSAAGVLGPVSPPLSESPGQALAPALSVGGGGDAGIVWLELINFEFRVEATFGP
jgi:hypothetical protein